MAHAPTGPFGPTRQSAARPDPAGTPTRGRGAPWTGVVECFFMSLAQILDELPKLTPEERQQVFLRLQALEDEPDVEATPEMLSAIDEAIQASERGQVFTLDEVRAQAQAWFTK